MLLHCLRPQEKISIGGWPYCPLWWSKYAFLVQVPDFS